MGNANTTVKKYQYGSISIVALQFRVPFSVVSGVDSPIITVGITAATTNPMPVATRSFIEITSVS